MSKKFTLSTTLEQVVQHELAKCNDTYDAVKVIACIFETIHQEMVSREWDKTMTYTDGTITGWLNESTYWEKE